MRLIHGALVIGTLVLAGCGRHAAGPVIAPDEIVREDVVKITEVEAQARCGAVGRGPIPRSGGGDRQRRAGRAGGW